MYRQNSYNGTISFDGKEMKLSVFANEKDLFNYVVSQATCVTEFSGLKKTYQTSDLPGDFLPVCLFAFVSGLGVTFTTEEYDEKNNTFLITKPINEASVTLYVKNKQDAFEYIFEIK